MIRLNNDEYPEHSMSQWSRKNDALAPKIIASILVSILIITATVAGLICVHVNSTIESRSIDIPVKTNSGRTMIYDPIDPSAGQPINILILGQDTREGKGNADIGGNDPNDVDNHQADTAMIVHISANRERIDIVSLTRDSIVNQPECATTNGVAPARDNVMLNSTFAYGYSRGGNLASAVSCELATVTQTTGIEITQTIVVDFAGFKDMIDAIGGVEICVPSAVSDVNTGIELQPGLVKMNGMTATQYARVRHGVTGGDGSDIMRTARQQSVVRALLRSSLSSGTLSNPSRLYQLGIAALDSLHLSTGLASAPTLAGLAYSLRGLHMDNVYTMTVPVVPWVKDTNRVVWAPEAENIWTAIRNDKPIHEHDEEVPGPQDSGSVPQPEMKTDEWYTKSDDDTPDSTESPTPVPHDTPSPIPEGFHEDKTTGLWVNDTTGELRDPSTGGIVDPHTGYIRDTITGSVIGLADKYVNVTICKANVQ